MLFYATYYWLPSSSALHERLMVLLCPPAILFLFPNPPTAPFLPVLKLTAAIVGNAAIYGTIGLLLWFGHARHFFFYFVAAALLAGIWWRVLTL